MRKKAALIVLVLVGALGVWAAEHPARFANVSFSFWRAGSGNGGIVGFPEPREVLAGDMFSLPLDGNEPVLRILEKEGYKIVIAADSTGSLTIAILRGEAALHSVRLIKPSGAEFVFYDADSRKHGVHVSYTMDDYRIGMVSPGILH